MQIYIKLSKFEIFNEGFCVKYNKYVTLRT